MKYFIYGNPIELWRQVNPGSYEQRYFVTNQEIQQAYPTQGKVKLFRSEQDALDYCNSIRESDAPGTSYGFFTPSYRLRPIYAVECDEGQAHFDWKLQAIEFNIALEDKNSHYHFKTGYSNKKIQKEKEIMIAEIELASLKPIRGVLREYYNTEDEHTLADPKGHMNFQSAFSCHLF